MFNIDIYYKLVETYELRLCSLVRLIIDPLWALLTWGSLKIYPFPYLHFSYSSLDQSSLKPLTGYDYRGISHEDYIILDIHNAKVPSFVLIHNWDHAAIGLLWIYLSLVWWSNALFLVQLAFIFNFIKLFIYNFFINWYMLVFIKPQFCLFNTIFTYLK